MLWIVLCAFPVSRLMIYFSHHAMHHVLNFNHANCRHLPWVPYLLSTVCATDSLRLTDGFDLHYEHHFASTPVSHACSGVPHRHGFTVFASKQPLLSSIFFDFEDRSFAWLYSSTQLASAAPFLLYDGFALLLALSVRLGTFSYATVLLLGLCHLNHLCAGVAYVDEPFRCTASVKAVYDVLSNESALLIRGTLAPNAIGRLKHGYPPEIRYECTQDWARRLQLVKARASWG